MAQQLISSLALSLKQRRRLEQYFESPPSPLLRVIQLYHNLPPEEQIEFRRLLLCPELTMVSYIDSAHQGRSLYLLRPWVKTKAVLEQLTDYNPAWDCDSIMLQCRDGDFCSETIMYWSKHDLGNGKLDHYSLTSFQLSIQDKLLTDCYRISLAQMENQIIRWQDGSTVRLTRSIDQPLSPIVYCFRKGQLPAQSWLVGFYRGWMLLLLPVDVAPEEQLVPLQESSFYQQIEKYSSALVRGELMVIVQ